MKRLFWQALCAAAMFAGACASAFGQTPTLEDAYFDSSGVRLHYVSAGSGPLIIFLHGFPEFWYQWKPQLDELAKDFHVVALDMRGYNLSDKPTGVEHYRVHALVDDVHALANHFGAKKFVLVGQDWGGVVAWAFALYRPHELERLVVLNAPHPQIFDRELKENPAQQLASRYMLTVDDPQSAAHMTANNFAPLVQVVLADGIKAGRIADADRDAYLTAWAQPGAIDSGLNYYRAAGVRPPNPQTSAPANGNYTPDLKSAVVRVPTLLIWGMQDRYLLSGNLSGIRRVVPNVTVKLFADGSHWINREKPAEVNAAIREFVRGTRKTEP